MLKGNGFFRKIESTKKVENIKVHQRAKKYYINHFAVIKVDEPMCFTLIEEYLDRELKVFEELKELNYIDYAFIDKKTIKITTLFKPKMILNKGLEIREKKRKKQAEKRYTVNRESKRIS